MNKRVHQIAKERGLPPKQVLARLQAAGFDVKAASSSVDEAAALRALDNGGAGGGRRVVIDSQASRRAPSGGGPPQSNQPPRRQRRGRRRRGIYDEEAESRPAASRTAVAEPDAIRINSGSTVKDVAEYLD